MIHTSCYTHIYASMGLLYMVLNTRKPDFVACKQQRHRPSGFIWPFLPPSMGVIPNPKMVFIFPILCILVLIFSIFMIYFPKCEGKGSFPKSQIKSLRPACASAKCDQPLCYLLPAKYNSKTSYMQNFINLASLCSLVECMGEISNF